MQAYKKSVEYSQELVNYGMANYLEVLNANVNQLNAEINIANAEYAKLQSGVELYRALGGGWSSIFKNPIFMGYCIKKLFILI
jgi:outer membrane protein TolC